MGLFLIMKAKKVNYGKLGVQGLEERYGYAQDMAKKVWRSIYRQSLYRARKKGVTKDINISREVYSSLFYGGQQLFDINMLGVLPKARVSKQFENVDNLQEIFTQARFKGMADKYSEVNEMMQRYKSGQISYKEFRQGVETFRKTNRQYMSRYSG